MSDLFEIKKFSIDEYEKMQSDTEERSEYCNGDIRVCTPEGDLHQRVIANLCGLFKAVNTNICEPWEVANTASNFNVFSGTISLKLSVNNDLQVLCPDVLVGFGDTPEHKGIFAGDAKIAAEVVTMESTNRDRFSKLSAYAKYGISEYWVADPDNGRIEVYFIPLNGEYVSYVFLEAEDIVETKLVKGLSIKVKELLNPGFSDRLLNGLNIFIRQV